MFGGENVVLFFRENPEGQTAEGERLSCERQVRARTVSFSHEERFIFDAGSVTQSQRQLQDGEGVSARKLKTLELKSDTRFFTKRLGSKKLTPREQLQGPFGFESEFKASVGEVRSEAFKQQATASGQVNTEKEASEEESRSRSETLMALKAALKGARAIRRCHFGNKNLRLHEKQRSASLPFQKGRCGQQRQPNSNSEVSSFFGFLNCWTLLDLAFAVPSRPLLVANGVAEPVPPAVRTYLALGDKFVPRKRVQKSLVSAACADFLLKLKRKMFFGLSDQFQSSTVMPEFGLKSAFVPTLTLGQKELF